MRVFTLVAAALFLASPAVADNLSKAPLPGTYGASVYVTDANGEDCLDQMGLSFAGVMNFSGLSGSKHFIRVPVLTFESPAVIMTTQTLAATGGKGTTKPNGTFTWTGNTVKGKAFSYTGVFSGKITEVSNNDFILDLTETYKHCTEYFEIGLVLASPSQ